MNDDLIFHYCDNQKMANILAGKTLRMSDITKSNDYWEVKYFFPGILDALQDEYANNPFALEYMGKKDEGAFNRLLQKEYEILEYEFSQGGVANFVVCFCEKGDVLSQWRGYANDGKGCSLGFSISELKDYCSKNNEAITLERVEYKTPAEMDEIIIEKAIKILDELKNMRKYIKEEFPFANTKEKVDKMLKFFFHQMIVSVLMGSLKYKNKAFEEEKEWRIYFKQQIYKFPKYIFSDEEDDHMFWDSTIQLIRNKVDFCITDDDLVAFYPIKFGDISSNPVKKVIAGPKNHILLRDFLLYIKSKSLSEIDFEYSSISYR